LRVCPEARFLPKAGLLEQTLSQVQFVDFGPDPVKEVAQVELRLSEQFLDWFVAAADLCTKILLTFRLLTPILPPNMEFACHAKMDRLSYKRSIFRIMV
jgi:hypothetical protein